MLMMMINNDDDDDDDDGGGELFSWILYGFFPAGTFTRWIFYQFKSPISYEQDLNLYQIYILTLIYEFETSIGSC